METGAMRFRRLRHIGLMGLPHACGIMAGVSDVR